MEDVAIILAAGLGTRMRSRKPKALHALAGRPMLLHLIAACEAAGFARAVVVAGPDMPGLAAAVAPHAVAVQHDRLGTAHAAQQALALLEDAGGACLVLYADNPLLRPATLAALGAARPEGGLALLAMRPADPGAYGRLVLDEDGGVGRIVEFADASPEERRIGLCNVGAFLASRADLARWLGAVRNDNAKGEYYLTDIVAAARAEGRAVRHVEADEAECLGVNSRAELARAEAAMQQRLQGAAMEGGATLVAPETIFLAHDTRLAADVVVHPHVVFGPGVVVEEGAEIRSFSHLEACTVGPGALVGPFARLRPGAVLGAGAHVGNFVELKNTMLGDGAKANHLSYLGDAVVGARANIGAGTITCNYDGVGKYRTEIGAGAFIGSNTALVAPVRIGAGAIVGAGSTIVHDVADDAVAVARGEQSVRERAAERFRQRRRAAKAGAKADEKAGAKAGGVKKEV
ncbi:MAG: bifunctional UDP-N-acetylglucosamine diphosphorylase/glucosamine-1-phosphate N-acetyltransferase GlmU [Acetobacteraceae bacterium]|nr:bifunctional UDP-N-acetylglucosamine diphosphorylase/glucosamine-1-phosphate N-acetyltransferase GlmU [Acetobacteraceae bacterium]